MMQFVSYYHYPGYGGSWQKQNSINEYYHVRGHQETNCIDHSKTKHYYQWQFVLCLCWP